MLIINCLSYLQNSHLSSSFQIPVVIAWACSSSHGLFSLGPLRIFAYHDDPAFLMSHLQVAGIKVDLLLNINCLTSKFLTYHRFDDPPELVHPPPDPSVDLPLDTFGASASAAASVAASTFSWTLPWPLIGHSCQSFKFICIFKVCWFLPQSWSRYYRWWCCIEVRQESTRPCF